MIKQIDLNPNQLIFREFNQNNTVAVREIIEDCPPITAYFDGETYTIIDGHNRTKVALEIGLDEITVRYLSKETYCKLEDMGYGVAEISIALHLYLNDYDAANWINQESAGFSLYNKAEEILEVIESC